MSDYQGKLPVKNNGIYDGSTNDEPSSSAIVASERNASISELTLNKRPTAKAGDEDKIALDVSISDGNGDSINSNNPLPIYITDSPATEIEDYNLAVDVIKAGGFSNHDYVTGSEFRGLNVEAGSAGLGVFELQVETAVASGTFNTINRKFNSVANPEVVFAHRFPAPIASGLTIRVVKTNLEKNQNTDMHSLINGTEV